MASRKGPSGSREAEERQNDNEREYDPGEALNVPEALLAVSWFIELQAIGPDERLWHGYSLCCFPLQQRFVEEEGSAAALRGMGRLIRGPHWAESIKRRSPDLFICGTPVYARLARQRPYAPL